MIRYHSVGKRPKPPIKFSVTWLQQAYAVRQRSVHVRHQRSFQQFLTLSRPTLVKWITKAKKDHLDTLGKK